MRHYTTAETMRVFMALGFESEDSYNLTMGWNDCVSYFTLGYTN